MDKKEKKKTKVEEEILEPIAFSGDYRFPNGDCYAGEVLRLQTGTLERHGMGTYTTTDGTVYTGQWSNDQMNGEGFLQFPSGASYQGYFASNKFNGCGRFTWSNGTCCQGSFVNNKMDGYGEYADTNGRVWDGSFSRRAACGLRHKLTTC